MRDDWQDLANCLHVNPRFFFPENKEQEAFARKVCAGCCVQAQCREFSMQSNNGRREVHGVWAGKNLEKYERTEVQKRQRQQRRAAS